jgi:hypothetical protein
MEKKVKKVFPIYSSPLHQIIKQALKTAAVTELIQGDINIGLI